MTPHTPVLFVDQGVCRIHLGSTVRELKFPADATPEQMADAINAALQELDPAGREVAIAVPADWCLCASIERDGPSRAIRRMPMLYQLEEHLPLTAEEMVADYIPAERMAFAVALRVSLIQPLVEAIEQLGWVIGLISPTALLAAQSEPFATALHGCDLLAIGNGRQMELMRFTQRTVTEWISLPADPEDAAMAIGLELLSRPGSLRMCCTGVPDAVVERLQTFERLNVQLIVTPSMAESAVQAVQSFADGTASPWIQLRCDALGEADRLRPARRAIRTAMVATMIFILCISAALVWRTLGYQRMAEQFQAKQAEVFREVFQNRIDPDGIDIPSRLASEERRLRLLTGQSTDAPTQPSAMVLLRQVLARISPDTQCQVNELRLGEGKLYVEASAPSHASGAAFAAALSADRTFAIDSPRSEQIGEGKGVAIVVTGSSAQPAETSEVKP